MTAKTNTTAKTADKKTTPAKGCAAGKPEATPKKKLTNAERFPQAAKREAEAAAAKAAKKANGGKTVRKPMEKPERPAFVAKLLPKDAAVHYLTDTVRPRAGSRLFAHTHAALTVLGMLAEARPVVPARALRTILGATAVSHHLSQNNFEQAPDSGIRLTPAGLSFFRSRMTEGKVDTAAANGFVDMFISGTPSDAAQVRKGDINQFKL